MRRLALIVFGVVFLASCSKPAHPGPTSVAGTNTTITGTIVERLDGPPYSYLRLETEKGDVWVAVPATTIDGGTKVTITHGAAVKNFTAPRLGRRFELVVFGTVERQ